MSHKLTLTFHFIHLKNSSPSSYIDVTYFFLFTALLFRFFRPRLSPSFKPLNFFLGLSLFASFPSFSSFLFQFLHHSLSYPSSSFHLPILSSRSVSSFIPSSLQRPRLPSLTLSLPPCIASSPHLSNVPGFLPSLCPFLHAFLRFPVPSFLCRLVPPFHTFLIPPFIPSSTRSRLSMS